MSNSDVVISTPTAHRAFVNGKIVTVNSKDEVTEALAVRDNRILRVGNRAYVEQTFGPDTDVVNLNGRTLIPGFIENHIHMTNSPQRLWVNCSYTSCPAISDIVEKISARARETKSGQWILGRGFQSVRLKERRNPNRLDLDPASPHNPVAIANREGMGWTFNTLGLRRIGVEDHTPDPLGGPMERDVQGRPLGPMWDNTREVFIKPNLPKFTLDDLIEGYRWISGELNRYGVTTAFEAAIRNPIETAAWQRLRLQSPLSLRVIMGPYPVYGDQWETNSTAGKIFDTGFATGFGDRWLKLGAVQIGIDGGVIGQTAALFEPYSDDPTAAWRGSFRLSQDAANAFMVKVQSQGWQAGLICHGDRGIMSALDAIAFARRQTPVRDLRHRFEHAYLWNPEIMDRMAELGVLWNTQPPLLEIIGREGVYSQWGKRAQFAFPFKSLFDRGVIISGGSDWPVGLYNPLIGVDILVNHRFGPEDGGEVLNASESLSVLQAIRVYTYNGAYTAFEEHEKGSLEEGKLADLAVLSDDILTLAPTRIREVQVDQTYVDGRLVYDRVPSQTSDKNTRSRVEAVRQVWRV
jgi:predicted amidohydrolase YtcJ